MISESLDGVAQLSASAVWHVISVSSGARCFNQKSNRVWMALYKQAPPPLASRAQQLIGGYRGFIGGSGRTAGPAARKSLRVCRARLHFADRLRAGAGRRSGSGWRQGRVR